MCCVKQFFGSLKPINNLFHWMIPGSSIFREGEKLLPVLFVVQARSRDWSMKLTIFLSKGTGRKKSVILCIALAQAALKWRGIIHSTKRACTGNICIRLSSLIWWTYAHWFVWNNMIKLKTSVLIKIWFNPCICFLWMMPFIDHSTSNQLMISAENKITC